MSFGGQGVDQIPVNPLGQGGIRHRVAELLQGVHHVGLLLGQFRHVETWFLPEG